LQAVALAAAGVLHLTFSVSVCKSTHPFLANGKNMNRTQHYSLLKAMEIDKSNLLKYQELYKYAYLLSDGIFKIVFAKEKDHLLLISLVNAMLNLQGADAIKDITLEMQEFPGAFNKKDCILVFFREVLTQLKLRNFIEKDILRLSNGKAVLPC
jgi:hypothetical protein